jgi:hypothetical protein
MATARVLIVAVVLTALVGEGRSAAQDDDTPLRPSAGPYRGVVVDDKTGRPLPSAAVIILWQRVDDQVQGLRRLSGAREAFTNEHGEFVHDVTSVEVRLRPTLAARSWSSAHTRPAEPAPALPPGVPAARFTRHRRGYGGHGS